MKEYLLMVINPEIVKVVADSPEEAVKGFLIQQEPRLRDYIKVQIIEEINNDKNN